MDLQSSIIISPVSPLEMNFQPNYTNRCNREVPSGPLSNPSHTSSLKPQRSITYTTVQLAASIHIVPSQSAVGTALALCAQECDRFGNEDHAQPIPPNVGLHSFLYSKEECRERLPYLLLELYWRSQKQILIFKAFLMLEEAGHLDTQALETPIDYHHLTSNVLNVVEMLYCFSEIYETDFSPEADDGCTLLSHDIIDGGTLWLAIMICRCCKDMVAVNQVMMLIAESAILGGLSLAGVDRVNADRAKEELEHQERTERSKRARETPPAVLTPFFEHNENENAREKSSHQIFGFILPDGTGEDVKELYSQILRRVDEIETAFRDFFGELVMEMGRIRTCKA
ncbi:MAG: hypothetical protein Q9166_002518 [cf. Caloplaca sp. 2 TL-2023]